MAEYPPGLSPLSKHQFERTEKLFSQSFSSWSELEHLIECSGRSIDDWITAAEHYEGPESFFYASYLKAIKHHIHHASQRKALEKAHPVFSNRIRPSLLVRRV